jgi:Holliday junction resolvasome RuvABC endonuclease subunit
MTERIAVLGVDPSLTGLGFSLGVYSAAGVALLPEYDGWVATDTATSPRDRVARYRRLSDEVVELARQHKPRVVVFEGHNAAMTFGRAFDRAEARSVLYERIEPHCDQMLEALPSQLQKFVTGRGGHGAYPKGLSKQQLAEQKRLRRKLTKGAVKKAMEERFGIALLNDDVGDARALLCIGLCLCELAEPETHAQREVVETLREKAVEAA